jgi:hypothetical protein
MSWLRWLYALPPRVEDIWVDGRVVAFGFLVALMTGVLFGIAPSLLPRSRTGDPQQAGHPAFGRDWVR